MYHLLDMEKSLDVHMYECKECSYTTTYEHYFQRHIKTHRREGDASSNSHASVTNKTFAAELTCPNLNVQPEKKMKSTIETMHIENSESLPTHEEAFIICDGEKVIAKKERLIKQNRCDLTKNPILSLEDISGTHYQQRLYHCHICQYSNSNKKVVTSHIKLKHLGEAPCHCSECDIPFSSRGTFYQHNVKHHPTRVAKRSLYARREQTEVLLSCPDCSFTSTTEYELAKHSMIHTIPKSELFSCHVCFKDFRTQNALKSHFGRYHKRGEPYSCDMCSYKSKFPFLLSLHIRRHTKDFSVFCDKCDKGFFLKAELRRHKSNSARCGGPDFAKYYWMCTHDNCTYSTRDKAVLKDHEFEHVSTDPPYKCDMIDCYYTTFQGRNLRRHKIKKHGIYVSPRLGIIC